MRSVASSIAPHCAKSHLDDEPYRAFRPLSFYLPRDLVGDGVALIGNLL